MLGEDPDPAAIEQIEEYILILMGWLTSTPSVAAAETTLGEMLEFFIHFSIPTVLGGRVVNQYFKMAYTVLIDRVVPGIARLILALDAGAASGATVLGLPLGGGAVAVGAAGAALLIALACLGVAIYRAVNTRPYTPVCGGLCAGGNAAVDLGPVDAWQFLATEQRVFAEAMSKAQAICGTYASKCGATCSRGGTCKPNVSLQDFEPHFRGLWTTVVLEKFNCTCECL